MKNKQLIQDIEDIKLCLTEAQKALEDDKLQEAGDCTVAAQLRIVPVVKSISNLFNTPKDEN